MSPHGPHTLHILFSILIHSLAIGNIRTKTPNPVSPFAGPPCVPVFWDANASVLQDPRVPSPAKSHFNTCTHPFPLISFFLCQSLNCATGDNNLRQFGDKRERYE